jgi:hypothetical protein
MCGNWKVPMDDEGIGGTPPTGRAFGAGQHMSDVSAVLGSFCQKLDFVCNHL